MMVVAVALTGSDGVGGRGKQMGCPMGGREFISEGEVFDLVHIVPRITCIPSPRKNESPIYDLSFDCYSKIKA
jgi:hypothetical protein